MRVLKTLLIAVFAVSIPTLSFAGQDPMESCPAIAEVKAVNFDFAQSTDRHNWMVGKARAKFATNYSWMFAITHIQAADKNEAFMKSKTAINYLVFEKADKESLSCDYKGMFEGREIKGVALLLA